MNPILLRHACDIKRKTAVGTNGRSSMQTLHTAVPCVFLPMNHATAINNKFSIGRAFDCYFNAGQDVQPGDQLVWNGSTYTVKLVQPYILPLVGYTMAMTEQEVDPA